MPALSYPSPDLRDGVVRLRPLADADLAWLVEALQHPDIAHYTQVPSPYRDADARDWLELQPRFLAEGEGVHLLIVSAGDGRPLGAVGLNRFDWDEPSCHVGYWLAAGERGRGHVTRAVRLLAGWALAELGLARVRLLANLDNLASQAVAERAGFARVGTVYGYVLKKEPRDKAEFELRGSPGSGPAPTGRPEPGSPPTPAA
jgi:RimJ/RimL family protein N-acetyltransferase